MAAGQVARLGGQGDRVRLRRSQTAPHRRGLQAFCRAWQVCAEQPRGCLRSDVIALLSNHGRPYSPTDPPQQSHAAHTLLHPARQQQPSQALTAVHSSLCSADSSWTPARGWCTRLAPRSRLQGHGSRRGPRAPQQLWRRRRQTAHVEGGVVEEVGGVEGGGHEGVAKRRDGRVGQLRGPGRTRVGTELMCVASGEGGELGS